MCNWCNHCLHHLLPSERDTDMILGVEDILISWFVIFLQRVSIACYAKRCTSYRKSVRLTVCLTV